MSNNSSSSYPKTLSEAENIRDILPFSMNEDQQKQFREDENRYLFIEFIYDELNVPELKEIYRDIDEKQFIFRIEYTNTKDIDNGSIKGNVFLNKRSDYPERYYDYLTIELGSDFYDFYLANLYNPDYYRMDLRIIWWINKDEKRPLKVKYVRPTKYIFQRRYICIAYDSPDPTRKHIKRACPNIGIFHLRDNKFVCPTHSREFHTMTRTQYNPVTKNEV